MLVMNQAKFQVQERKKRKSTDRVQKDRGGNVQSKSRTENASNRSSDERDGSDKKMRTNAPGVNVNSAVNVSGTALRPGTATLSPQPQAERAGKNDDSGERKSQKGEHKAHPQTTNLFEKDKLSGKPAYISSSQQMNSNPAMSAQIGSKKQKSTNELEKSKEADRNKPPQPKKTERNPPPQPTKSSVSISKESGSSQSIGNRFVPPQNAPHEISQEQNRIRSLALSRSNAENSAAIAQNEPQRKDLLKPNNKAGASLPSGSKQRTGTSPPHTQQGRGESALREAKSSERSSSQTASPSIVSNGVATGPNEPMRNNDRQGNATKSLISQEVRKPETPKYSTAATSNAHQNGTTHSPQASTTRQLETPSIPANEKKDYDKTHNIVKKGAPKALPAANAENTENGTESDNDDVIDLTEESPTDENPPLLKTPSIAVEAPSSSHQAMKQGGEGNKDRNRAVPQGPPPPPSPPASPLPFATFHNPPPAPKPKPKPFSARSSLIFLPDGKPPNPIASGSLNGRTSCVLSFDAGYHLDGSGSCLDDELCSDVSERLRTWDPYWKIVEVLGTRKIAADPSQRAQKLTTVGTRTTPCQPSHQSGPVLLDHPSSCASVFVDMPKEVLRSKFSKRDSSGKLLPPGYRPWGVRWGSLSHPYKDERGKDRDRLQTGDRRLIVRTLPLQRPPYDTKKRADGHLWPKGTFLQLKQGPSEQVLSILQRKQQSHAHSEWKGMSHPLDLTLKVKSTNVPFELKLCSKEIIENSANYVDAVNGTLMGSYALHVAICEYVAPDDLYDRLMGNADGGDVTIPRISLRSARKMLKEYFSDQTVLIDDSDDEDKEAKSDEENKVEDSKSLTFSLLCQISKTAMQTPVRGRHCKHMQCMDLRNFLHANKNVTGGRWRCGVCEDFVNVRDLVHCGLFQAMLNSLGSQVSGARDRVSLRADGNWKLMGENRLRHNKRGRSLPSDTNNVNGGGTNPSIDTEVIDLI